MKKQNLRAGYWPLIGLIFLTINTFSQDPDLYIYLCFGQSNMEGQATIQSQDRAVDERFITFQALDCSNLNRTKETWYTAVPPTCQCYSKLSLADYFGRTMVANLPDNIRIGIVNVSIGGCDIRLFDKDIYYDYDSTYTESWFIDKVEDYEWNPYQYLINLALKAQQDGVIKGILLHQGETNTGQEAWPSYVKKIYNDMLTDLSLDADSVPILAGEVLSEGDNCCSGMNPIINRLPDTIPTAYVISSEGCSCMDEAHFDSEGYRKFGRRYGVQMLSLMGYEAAYAEPECGTVGDSWKIKEDEDASNNSYVTVVPGNSSIPEPPVGDENSVQVSFTVSKDSIYYLYGRFNNPSNEEDSYWMKTDNGAFELYDNLTTSGWMWLEVDTLELTAGEHTLTVAFCEEGARLDKLCIKNSRIIPKDVGEEAASICMPAFTPSETNTVETFKAYSLGQNYPNPTCEKTYLSFKVPVDSFVSLKVYNILGIEVAELAGKYFHAGEYSLEFIHDKLSKGNYFYTMKADRFSATRKMTVL